MAYSIPLPLKRGLAGPFAIWLIGAVFIALILVRAPGLTAHISVGFTFNEMLLQLLHGKFYLTQSTIGNEAFHYNGHAYAYFGIFCALLRLPLLITGTIRSTDMTVTSILIATAVSMAFRVASAVTVFQMDKAGKLSALSRNIILIAVAFSGESIQFLRPSVFQEIVSWGAALAAAFSFLALRVILGAARKNAATYVAMAAVAGLALLCRFSFGLGLSAALGFMLAMDSLQSLRAGAFAAALRRAVPAAAVLALFVAVVGAINFARWGDPLTFIPLRLQTDALAAFPDRLPRLERFGEFNLARVPFGLQYYFAPIWELQNQSGALLFQRQQLQMFDVVEIPPGSLLLSDPVTCLFALIGVGLIFRRPNLFAEPGLARAVLLGLSIPAVVMLGAIAMTFRYRMEFYPVLDFACWLGLAAVVLRDRAVSARSTSLLAVVAGVGLLIAGMSRVAYAASPFGSLTDIDLTHGWSAIYSDKWRGQVDQLGHMMPDGSRLPMKPQLANDGPAEF